MRLKMRLESGIQKFDSEVRLKKLDSNDPRIRLKNATKKNGWIQMTRNTLELVKLEAWDNDNGISGAVCERKA
jgi:hypothetical protein